MEAAWRLSTRTVSKRLDLKLLDRLEFGLGAVAMRYQEKERYANPRRPNASYRQGIEDVLRRAKQAAGPKEFPRRRLCTSWWRAAERTEKA
jgi:hypothetical protein